MRRCFECLKTLRKSLHSRLCLFLLSSANRSPFLACTFNVCWLSLCLGVVVKQAIWLIAAVYPYCQYCASKDLAWWFCTVGQKCSVYPCPSTPYDVILSLQGHAVAGYAPLITAYIKVLMSRITFTIKVNIQWRVRESRWLDSSSFSPAEPRNSRYLELRGQAFPSAV